MDAPAGSPRHALFSDENRFRTLVENMNQGIAVGDARGRIVFANTRFCELLGLSEEHVQDHVFTDLVDEPAARRWTAEQQKRRQGLRTTYELEIRRHDGRIIRLLVSGSPLFDEAGEFCGSLGLLTDVTELRRTEQDLNEARARFEALFNGITDGVLLHRITPDGLPGGIIEANDVACRMLGYSRDELQNLDIGRIDAPESPVDVRRIVEDLRAGRDVLFEQTHVTRDGRRLPVEVHARVLNIQGQQAILSTIRDISERRRMEQELGRLEREKSLVLDATSELFCYYDTALRIRWTNRAAAASVGLDAEDLVGRHCYEIWQSRSEPCENCPVLRARDTRVAAEAEVTAPDGRVFALRGYPVMDEAGNICGLVELGRNVTERCRAEREREKLARALEEKNRELTSLMYAASHDLRAPLLNVHGFTGELRRAFDLVREELTGVALPPETRRRLDEALERDIPEALEYIAAGVRKTDSLLAGLLQVCRLGRAEPLLTDIDMEALLAEVIAATRFQIRQAGAEVSVGPLPPCRGDAALVNRLFSNLLDNAVKYLDPARKGCIRITGRPEGDRCRYCVEDNGRGIPPQHIERIFDLFHRVPGQQSVGDGIGLAVVRRIADLLDGRVWVESEPGGASRFFIELPAVGEAGARTAGSTTKC